MDDIKVKGDGGIEKIKWLTTYIYKQEHKNS